ncbi:MAG: zinc finger Ran-binding domain-containing protein [Sandaracinaceae bacterium]|nr:zinc finger Ran-binding domain-containing protein [Sandaracinaceae bacterium]
MANAELLVCHVCGFQNQPGTKRCISCGARLEQIEVQYTATEAARKRNQQEGFSPIWVLVSMGIYLLLQAFFIALLPLVIPSYDPQGFPGLALSILIWFIGGIAVGFVSPGKTFLEPAAGALIAVVPTIVYLRSITPDGFEPSMVAYVVGGGMGVMISLFGAFVGESVQKRVRGAAQ